MKNLAIKLNKLSEHFVVRVIRRGMMSLIPMVITASLSLAVLCFPIVSFQHFLIRFCGGFFYHLLEYVKDFSFSFFSVMLTIAISYSYVIEKKETIESAIFAPIASCVSFLLICHIGMEENVSNLGAQGCFLAIFVAFFVSAGYVALVRKGIGRWISSSYGQDLVYRKAMQAAIPMAILMLGTALASYLIFDVCHISNFNQWLGMKVEHFLQGINSDFLTAVLCTLMIHLLWFLGIHGSNAMEVVVNAHIEIQPDVIFNKTFLDVFVLMGGCGTSICILLAVLCFSRYKKTKNLMKTAALPVVLNINELITFGLPIIWNPMMFVPFLAVPLECTVISYAAFKLGLVAPIVTAVNWTTPALFSGYLACGHSVSGIVLQVVNITAGVFTYLPFVRIYERYDEHRVKDQIKAITDELKACESSGEDITFLDGRDEIGAAANMLMDELHEAVRNRQLYFMYQPQFEASGKCIGAEALIRWNHPIAGMIYPPLIILLAKRGNFLSEIEYQIFDMACEAIKKIDGITKEPFKISVNITAKSLRWDGLEDCIQNAVERYGISPEKLWVEVTEQDILAKTEEVNRKIRSIREKGHKFLIDDFGVGKTSILYLQTKMFDGVKIDGFLTKTLLTDNVSRQIVTSVIDLSNKLGMCVIAEFVERKEECDLLDELGCTWYQGYYFSKPVMFEQFEKIMKAGKV